MNDRDLAALYPWMDKRVLDLLLGRRSMVLQPGAYWIKPAVSEDGLGVEAQRLYLSEQCVIQPEYHGPYACIDYDHRKDEWHVWTAKRRGPFFVWFRYCGGVEQVSTRQRDVCRMLGAMKQPAAAPADGSWVNVEFLGEEPIEAHARPSSELIHDPGVWTVPVWAPTRAPEPTGGAGVQVLDAARLDPDETPVRGLRRWWLCMVSGDRENVETWSATQSRGWKKSA